MGKLRQINIADWELLERFLVEFVPTGHIASFEFNKHWFGIPNSNQLSGFVIEDSCHNIKGVMMVIEAPILWFNSKKTMGWISTGLVDESLRSTTAGPQLYLNIYKRYDVVGALSGNEYSLPINSILGKSILGLSMVRFLFVNSVEVSSISQHRDLITINGRKSLFENTSFYLTERKHLPDDYDLLWSNVRNNFDFITNKTSSYLKWRYIDAPLISYKILDLRGKSSLVALIIVRVQHTPSGNVLRILDMVVDKKNIINAINAVTNYSIEIGCIFTDFFVIGEYYNEGLSNIGYLSSEKDNLVHSIPHLLSPVEHRSWSNTFNIGGKITSSNARFYDTKRILFTKGDGDRDWPTNYDLG